MNEEELEEYQRGIQTLIDENEAVYSPYETQPQIEQPEEQPVEQVEQPEEEEEEFDPSKDYSYYAAKGMSRQEWTRRQMGGGVDADMAAFAEDPRAAAEAAAAIPLSLVDFGVDALTNVGAVLPSSMPINALNQAFGGPDLEAELRKLNSAYDDATKFENDYIQKIRKFSSVVLPTMFGTGALTSAVRGMNIGRLLKGAIGVTGAAAIDAGVIGISDEGLENNTFRSLSDTFPETFGPNGQFAIPDSIKTLDKDSPEVRKHKNQLDSVAWSFVGDLLGFIIGSGKKPLSWLQPKSREAVQYKANQIAELDPESTENIFALEELIRLADTPADKARYKAARDQYLKELNATGSTTTTTKTSAEVELEQAEASRQIQIDEEGIRRLEAPVATFDPFITPGLARQGSLAVQTIPPASIARNMTDVAAIKKGVATGDPAPVLSEPFIKKALGGESNTRNVVAGITEEVRQIGKFDATVNGFRITAKELKELPWDVYTDIMRPTADATSIRNQFVGAMDRKILQDEFGNDVPVYYFNEKQTLASAVAINDLVDLYIGREVTESSARIMDTLGREITSIAEGSLKYSELADDPRVQEMILDKLEFLMTEHGLNKYIAGWSLRQKRNIIDFLKGADVPDEAAISLKSEFDEVFAQRTASVKQFRQTIEELRETNPEAIRSLVNAFAMSNGDVDTIAKMTAWARKQVSGWGLFKSPEPGQMNLMAKGFWAVRYNNILSGLSAARAFVGNSSQLITKSMTALLGAGMESLLKRDLEPVKRTLYYYSATHQTMARALQDAIARIKQVNNDPEAFQRAIREDYVIKEDKKWETLEAMVPMWEKEGNTGLLIQYRTAKAMHDASKIKAMRYGTTLMSGIDAGTDTFMATLVSRYRAYDDVITQYGEATPELLLEAEKRHYSKMFDAQGILSDDAVKNMSGEIALNLDDGIAQFINSATASIPPLKTFMMFPKTSLNMFKTGLSYTPIAAIPGASKYGKILNAGDDINKIKAALAEHGIKDFDATPNAMAIYKNLRTEYAGRLALSALTVSVLYGYAMSGNIRGNGAVNGSQRKKDRDNFNWQPKTINIGGKWVSYDGIIPLDPLLSVIGDMAYYVNDLGSPFMDKIQDKLAWTVAATWLNNTPLAGIEPLLKGLNGDEAAWSRWMAQQARGTIPMSGALGVVSNAITNSQKDIYNDMIGYIANRIPGASSTLPERIDYWTGKPINDISNPFMRALNAVNPIKVHDGAEPWREWLFKSGWDGFNMITKHSDGYEYSAEQREAIGHIIGKMELWKKVEEFSKNKRFNDELNDLRAARNNPLANQAEVELKAQNLPVYRELNRMMRSAIEAAEFEIERNDKYADIRQLTQGQSWVDQAMKRGDIPEAQRRQSLVQERLDALRNYANR